MKRQLALDYLEAKERVLSPCCTGDEGAMTSADKMALVEARAAFGCLLDTASDMVAVKNKITPILKNGFDRALCQEHDRPQLQEYHQRFVTEATLLLERTNVCELPSL